MANRVYCITTGRVYKSISEASREEGLAFVSILDSVRYGVSVKEKTFKLAPPTKKQPWPAALHDKEGIEAKYEGLTFTQRLYKAMNGFY